MQERGELKGELCHAAPASSSLHKKFVKRGVLSPTYVKPKIQIFTPIHNILTPGLELLTPAPHVVHVTKNIRYGPESPPPNPFCWSNRLKLLLQLIWDVSLHNWRVHPLYSCTRLCFRLPFKQLSTYLMHRTLYEQVLEILLP